MITLEKIDYVMNVTGVDYKTVRRALLENDGDVDKAIELINNTNTSFYEKIFSKDSITFDDIKKVINDFWRQGTANRLLIKKGDKVILSLSLAVSAIGIIMDPVIAFLGVGTGLISDYDFFIELEDGNEIDLKKYILGNKNN